MYAEGDLLPISMLQHLVFCERQWALIHLEGVWEENRLTAEGRVMHERVHEAEAETRGDLRIARGLRVRSLRLGLTGQCDVVEFRQGIHHGDTGNMGKESAEIGTEGAEWVRPVQADTGQRGMENRRHGTVHPQSLIPFPIEYKRGKPKPDRCDEVQLCAQALCLEEMLGVAVPEGALFYGRTRRRHAVRFDGDLRQETERMAARLHELYRTGATPQARYEKKCDSCSLYNVCLPKTTGGPPRVSDYLARAIAADGGEERGL